jgi:hypothetical protein
MVRPVLVVNGSAALARAASAFDYSPSGSGYGPAVRQLHARLHRLKETSPSTIGGSSNSSSEGGSASAASTVFDTVRDAPWDLDPVLYVLAGTIRERLSNDCEAASLDLFDAGEAFHATSADADNVLRQATERFPGQSFGVIEYPSKLWGSQSPATAWAIISRNAMWYVTEHPLVLPWSCRR